MRAELPHQHEQQRADGTDARTAAGVEPSPASPEPPRPARRRMGLVEYLSATTSLFNSLVLVVPVFVVYQVGILAQLFSETGGSYAINGADYLTRSILRLCGGSRLLYVVFVALAAGAFGLVLRWLARRDALAVRLYLPMLLESTVYALLFASTIHGIQSAPQLLAAGLSLAGPSTTWEMIFQSFGAGFNEELIFRFGLLGGTVVVGRLLRIPDALTLGLAFIGSSLAFSAFHYVGAYADALAFDSFMYRFMAGILLATIYWWRGLGVAVYTHAFYDLYFFFVLADG